MFEARAKDGGAIVENGEVQRREAVVVLPRHIHAFPQNNQSRNPRHSRS